jgi:molecular chaperone HscC
VAPFTLGVETSREMGNELRTGYFLPIVNRNTTIPVSRVDRVCTVRPNQTEVVVRIFQGESRRVADNLLLGEFEVRNIPRGPAGQSVDIRFTYDLNGVLEVEATVVETREKFSHLVTRYARGLSSAQIAQALAEMEKLKTHPREETANRYLIRRAERVYQELSLPQRERLDMLLSGFEEALELGDLEAIERHRTVVLEFLDRHDPAVDGQSEWQDGE